ncbi:MAG: dTDP-4-dehydrorhamnose 3,5-epimerase [Myxococcales bacterium]|nr:dTDP-4-dehydrorhamnose 3,5-epimerase [Myxococcales bacterium]
MSFEFIPQSIPDVLIVRGSRFGDHRGFFSETFRSEVFVASGLPQMLQHNHSRSPRGVLRGLHYQLEPRSMGKLVRCARGAIFDVAVDVRKCSPTFGQYVTAELSDEENTMLWVPPGFAHGFLALSELADCIYMQSDYWSPDQERCLRWNDPTVGVPWPIQDVKLSAKDAQAPMLDAIETNFRYHA